MPSSRATSARTRVLTTEARTLDITPSESSGWFR